MNKEATRDRSTGETFFCLGSNRTPKKDKKALKYKIRSNLVLLEED